MTFLVSICCLNSTYLSINNLLDLRVYGTTMMSNTTLDAAKTSRMLQLLQTQANMEDLRQLAWCLLVEDDEV